MLPAAAGPERVLSPLRTCPRSSSGAPEAARALAERQPVGGARQQEARLITIGVDAPKRVHAAVALDDRGGRIGHWRGPNSAHGGAALRGWAGERAGAAQPRRWGSEGAWGYGRGLAQSLVAGGEPVFEVNPRWTAPQRRHAFQSFTPRFSTFTCPGSATLRLSPRPPIPHHATRSA